MEQLATASIGLYNCKGQHYLQIIPADSQAHIFVKLSERQALTLADENKIEIAEAFSIPTMRLLNGEQPA